MIPSINFARPIGPYIGKVKSKGENLIAYEMGGLALANPSGGLEQQLWTAACLNGRDIYLSSRTTGRHILLPAAGDAISNIDLAFDQNMYPFLTWEDSGALYFYWYDPVVGNYVTNGISRARSPRCCLDDHRAFNVSNSDIVLAYIRDDTQRVCARIQRDRYGVEYDLCSVYDIPTVKVRDARDVRIRAVGMAMTLRLQFTFDVLKNTVTRARWQEVSQVTPVELI